MEGGGRQRKAAEGGRLLNAAKGGGRRRKAAEGGGKAAEDGGRPLKGVQRKAAEGGGRRRKAAEGGGRQRRKGGGRGGRQWKAGTTVYVGGRRGKA